MDSTANSGPVTAPAINRIREDASDVLDRSVEAAAGVVDVAVMMTPSTGTWMPLHPISAALFDTQEV